MDLRLKRKRDVLMAALDRAARRGPREHVMALMSSSRCRVSSMAGKLAILLLAVSLSMLLFASAALAHVPIQQDRERPLHHLVHSPQSEVDKPTAPSGCVQNAEIVVSIADLVAKSQLPSQDFTPDGNESDNIEFDADCCGVACHAALDSIGRVSGARRLSVSAVVLTGTSFLHGRIQGPPERPPRRIS